MPNSIHDAPGQAGMSNSPPGTSPEEDTGKGEIDYQPDYSPHSDPVDERNDDNQYHRTCCPASSMKVSTRATVRLGSRSGLIKSIMRQNQFRSVFTFNLRSSRLCSWSGRSFSCGFQGAIRPLAGCGVSPLITSTDSPQAARRKRKLLGTPQTPAGRLRLCTPDF